MTELQVRIHSRAGASGATLSVEKLVIAGWTGRDQEAMEHHIAELEALGVARPATTPAYYRVSSARLTLAHAIEVTGEETSGEVEFVLAAIAGQLYVGVGSDHTDRQLETSGVTLSKQICDKPIAGTFWPYHEVAGHWDELLLRSFVSRKGQRQLYQEGRAGAIMPPGDLVRGHEASGRLADGTVLFGGTFPALGGIRPADRFEGEIEDPVLDRRILFAYDVKRLPIVG